MSRRIGDRAPAVGILLKQWRRLRGQSQLSLAVALGISARHLSFIESGRARPSREQLDRVADGLQVPLRERNFLFASAGYAPVYPEAALDTQSFAPLRDALTRLLEHQEPYPAVLLDRQWNVVITNRTAPMLFRRFIDIGAQPAPPNLLRMMFSPHAMRPWVENWEAVSRALVQRVHREAVAGIPDPRVLALLEELRGEVPGESDLLSSPYPFEPIVLRRGELRLSFFSMVTTVGAPLDITAQELRIEGLFPADEVTERFAREELA